MGRGNLHCTKGTFLATAIHAGLRRHPPLSVGCHQPHCLLLAGPPNAGSCTATRMLCLPATESHTPWSTRWWSRLVQAA